jgi:hypothetical protein
MIPGFCYLALFSWGLDDIQISTDVQTISTLSIYAAVAFCFFSYIIGFISDSLASVIVVRIIDWFRGDIRDRVSLKFKDEGQKDEEYRYRFSAIYAFADVKAPQAREKADQFSAMSGLARNLALVFLVFAFSVGIRPLFNRQSVIWPIYATKLTVALGISIILMFRSDTFRRWSHSHLFNVYKLLRVNVPTKRRSSSK